MKKLIIIIAAFAFQGAKAQVSTKQPKQHQASFDLGSGLNFSFNDGAYAFNMGGMIQPYFSMYNAAEAEVDYFLNAKRTYFNLGGEARNEKLDFFVQMDFSRADPLLDVWIGYEPVKGLKMHFGQMQNIANNREMLLMENNLQFVERSALSTTFSRTGRELGGFVEYALELGNVVLVPQVSMTSGDGKNSFGVDSRDPDIGGFKYSTRIDLYPFGKFSEGNDEQIADLPGEEKLKMVIGVAASMNDGASDTLGEGHGELFLYNKLGQRQLPDYRKLCGDVLVKYKGFSFLGEYMIATAAGLSGAFLNESASVNLIPTQISEMLALGTAYNAQLGYVTGSGYGVDFRYSGVQTEFEENPRSYLKNCSMWSVGVTKYVHGNNLKLHLGYTSMQPKGEDASSLAEFMVQVAF